MTHLNLYLATYSMGNMCPILYFRNTGVFGLDNKNTRLLSTFWLEQLQVNFYNETLTHIL
jgi:hypothetical protein